MDWDNPSTDAIVLTLSRIKATSGKAQGSLLVNPGGPGGSGIEFLPYFSRIVSADVAAAYDIVSFDPRGVGLSTPISCGDDKELDQHYLTDKEIKSPADMDAAILETKRFGERCLKLTGPSLGFVDTNSAAKDMDLMRAVLGDEKLTYLGYSYGTQLGATYAGLFPQNVGRLVLDGAVDPSLSSKALSLQQAQGFDKAFRAYASDCLKAGEACPLQGSVDDAIKQVVKLLADAKANPLPTQGGERLNGALAYYGLIVAMYEDSSWPVLTAALTSAIKKNDGTQLRELANQYLSRDQNGHYEGNAMVAFEAINCLDSPTTKRNYDQLLAWRDEMAKVAPIVADAFAMNTGCEGWPFPNRLSPAKITADGAAPILVLGTTGDPATPYEWAVSLAGQLSSGVLLSWKGEGHTAYGRSNDCVREAVDSYLLHGTPPANNTQC